MSLALYNAARGDAGTRYITLYITLYFIPLLVSAQTSSPVPESTSTVSPSPAPTSPGPAPTSSLVPEPTETPPNPPDYVKKTHFFLNDKDNDSLICLNMTAAIVLTVNFTQEDNTVSTSVLSKSLSLATIYFFTKLIICCTFYWTNRE